MKYELAHDTLARQIMDRVSGEAKARRQAALLVERAWQRYRERGVLLQAEDLEEIRPHEAAINFTDEERAFIHRSKTALEQAARRKRQLVIGIISLLSVFLIVALWQWQRASASAKAQRQIRLALQAKEVYERGYPSLAFRLAQAAGFEGAPESSAAATTTEVLQKIIHAGLERELLHSDSVLKITARPGEPYILSITKGPEAIIWDLQGRAVRSLSHEAPLAGGAWSPWDGNPQVVTYTTDRRVHFWDESGTLISRQTFPFEITGIDLNSKHRLLLVWGQDQLALIDTEGKAWSTDWVSGPILHAQFSPNQSDLLLITPDSVTSWWLDAVRLDKAQPRFSIRQDVAWAGYVLSDRIQQQVIVQGTDGRSRVYDVRGQLDTSSYYQYLNRELAALPPIERFAFSYPGTDHPKTLFLTDSAAVRFWSAYRKHDDQERAGNLNMYTRTTRAISGVAFSPTDRFLLTAAVDGWVNIWDISKPNPENYRKFKVRLQQAVFMESDRYVVTTDGDRSIKVWRLQEPLDLSPTAAAPYYDQHLRPLSDEEKAIYLHY